MAKVYVSILPQPNYVCAVSFNIRGNSIAKRILVSQSVVTLQIMERKMFIRMLHNPIWILYVFIGVLWAWGIIAVTSVVIELNADRIYSSQDMPPIVNTIDTIPVVVLPLGSDED